MMMNMSETDLELLARYARLDAEDAFAEIVRRHLDLVHTAAFRQVRSLQLAEEVAQSTFLKLARHAGQFAPETIVTAWLYQVTRREAVDVIRREARRQLREQIALEMNAMNATAADWTNIEPLLDDAMSALDETDRTAVLLRYFENNSLREVGQTLGVTDDAAQKRVSRAVERLREFFAKRDVSVGTSGLVVAISVNAVQAAPVGLGVAISSSIIAGAGLTATASVTTTKAILMTTLQKALIAAVVISAVVAGIYESRQAAALQDKLQVLGRHYAELDGQIEEMTRQRDAASSKLAALQRDADQLRRNLADLPRIRAEVTRLQGDSQALAVMKTAEAGDPTQAEMKSWLARVNLLKQRLEQMPDKRIPEMEFVTEQDWLDAARGNLDTDTDYRRAMSSLRNAATSKFVPQLRIALRKYLDSNNKEFPTDIAQLHSYFEPPVSDAILQRYAVLPSEELPSLGMGGKWIISQRAPVDGEFDSRVGIGPNGNGSTIGPQAWDDPVVKAVKALDPVFKAYSAANGGRDPGDLTELLPFATSTEQRAALERVMRATKAASNSTTK